jgi:hypothetical protein
MCADIQPRFAFADIPCEVIEQGSFRPAKNRGGIIVP